MPPLDDGHGDIRLRTVLDELDRGHANLRFEITLRHVEPLDEVSALLHVGFDVRQCFLIGGKTFTRLPDDVLLEVSRVRVMRVPGEADIAQRDEWTLVHLEHEMFTVNDGITGVNVRVPILAVIEFEEKRQIVGGGGFESLGFDLVKGIEQRIVEVAGGERGHADELDVHVARRGRRGGPFFVARMKQRAGRREQRERDGYQGRDGSPSRPYLFLKTTGTHISGNGSGIATAHGCHPPDRGRR